MTPGRFAQLARGLNGVARKVLEAVPIQESWTAAQINTELHRVGARMDHSTLEGCLERLRRIKLVSEPSPGMFTRVQVRVSTRPDPDDEFDEEDTVTNLTTTPFDKLAQLTQQMRDLAKALEDVALEIQAEIEREQNKTAKLRQLQAALKELV